MMEMFEYHVCEICGLDLHSDLEMIEHISTQHHQSDFPETTTGNQGNIYASVLLLF